MSSQPSLGDALLRGEQRADRAGKVAAGYRAKHAGGNTVVSGSALVGGRDGHRRSGRPTGYAARSRSRAATRAR